MDGHSRVAPAGLRRRGRRSQRQTRPRQAAQPVEVDRWFRFVADEATADAEDEESEEDVLVMEPRFDLHSLIEDELLLALPLIPMHDVCPEPVRMSAGELPESAETEKPHPFAALAALRKAGGSGGKSNT